jgi:hypothetical protein
MGGNEMGGLGMPHWVLDKKKKKERVLLGIEGQFDVDKLMAGDSGDKTH